MSRSGTWDVAPGLYRILVGSSSQDIELRRPLVNSVPVLALGLGEHAGAGSKTPSELSSTGQSLARKHPRAGTPL